MRDSASPEMVLSFKGLLLGRVVVAHMTTTLLNAPFDRSVFNLTMLT